jgi:hypothetical protein
VSPDDAQQRHSLAFRKNREDIYKGYLPGKYARILPHIEGDRVLEIGAAEGVLSLALVRGHHVKSAIALELRDVRHQEALQLQKRLAEQGQDVAACRMVCGDIMQNLHLLQGIDTLIAVRAIYYLREDIPRFLQAAAAAGVMDVVLVGNKNRAEQAFREYGSDLATFNYPASAQGMSEFLRGAGFAPRIAEPAGDPIVVGTRV